MAKTPRAQKGFVYEKNAWNALKKMGIAGAKRPAGGSPNRPDIEIKYKIARSQTHGVELKLSPSAAGSIVMQYIEGKWVFGTYKGSAEKEFLFNLGDRKQILKLMNTSGVAGANWRESIPHLQYTPQGKKTLFAAKSLLAAYKKDIIKFGGQNEIHIPIQPHVISDYYNHKNTHYMNIGTHGFFLLNNSDPLKLNSKLKTKIPNFNNSAMAIIRVRAQKKQATGDYQFSMELEFKAVKFSPYNIAPTRSKTDVRIDKEKLNSKNNKPLFDAFNGPFPKK